MASFSGKKSDGDWEGRLLKLIRSYKPSEGGDGEFRRRYQAAVNDGVDGRDLESGEASTLVDAMRHLQQWSGSKPPSGAAAWEQWNALFAAGRGRLPISIFAALLRRLPAAPSGDPPLADLLIDDPRGVLVSAALERRFIKWDVLARLAEARPDDFYQSAIPDVLVGRKMPCPPVLWPACAQGIGRPIRLMAPEEVLVRSYKAGRVPNSDRLFLGALADAGDAGAAVLSLLLEERTAALRFCRFAMSLPTKPPKGKKAGAKAASASPEVVQSILRSWIKAARDAVNRRSHAETAAVVLAHIRLGLLENQGGRDTATSNLDTLAAEAAEQVLLRLLRIAEATSPEDARQVPVLIHGDEAYRAVQAYVSQLAIELNGGDMPPERALRLEQFRGSKAVLEHMLAALADAPGESRLHEAIEIALFNSGVRSLGQVGEVQEFDSDKHHFHGQAVLPSDQVVVTRPGRQLGEGDEAILLEKAHVRRA